MMQETYIEEMRDKSMKFEIETLKNIAGGSPLEGGGVFSHALTRLYTAKKQAPPSTKTDPFLDSFFEDVKVRETSIYEMA